MTASRRFSPLAVLAMSVLLIFVASAVQAAEVIIVNEDAAGVGLNDPTAAAPVAGNPGVTLGEQRLNVLERAAEIWASNLISDVPIRIRAITANQFCDATTATLASAGAAAVNRNFAGAPLVDTWYHAALANSIAGVDLSVGSNDINTQFNITLDDDPMCLGGFGWYYGYDHNEGNQVDLLAVMLHEYGHGLGFANFVNEAVGTFFSGFPDVYTSFTRDLETMTNWNDMSDAERIASAINDPDVVWTGANVTAAIPSFLDGTPIATINSPPAIAGVDTVQPAQFGPPVPEMGLTGDVVLGIDADDSMGGDFNDGCQALTNGAAIAGNIAMVNRGNCNFTVKVANAQAVGAVGAIISNNVADGLPPMGGEDATITIPSVGMLQATGLAIQGELPGVNVTLGFDNSVRAGTNGGFLRVNAPDPLQPGSSVSHWTPDANPSLLMEPSITPDLTDDVDLTLQLFEDIGWILGIFRDGFEDGTCDEWFGAVGGC